MKVCFPINTNEGTVALNIDLINKNELKEFDNSHICIHHNCGDHK